MKTCPLLIASLCLLFAMPCPAFAWDDGSDADTSSSYGYKPYKSSVVDYGYHSRSSEDNSVTTLHNQNKFSAIQESNARQNRDLEDSTARSQQKLHEQNAGWEKTKSEQDARSHQAAAKKAEQAQDMNDFVGAVYRGNGTFVKIGQDMAVGSGGTIVRCGDSFLTPKGTYVKVQQSYLRPDGGAVVNCSGSFVSYDGTMARSGDSYVGTFGTSVVAGSVILQTTKPDWASR